MANINPGATPLVDRTTDELLHLHDRLLPGSERALSVAHELEKRGVIAPAEAAVRAKYPRTFINTLRVVGGLCIIAGLLSVVLGLLAATGQGMAVALAGLGVGLWLGFEIFIIGLLLGAAADGLELLADISMSLKE